MVADAQDTRTLGRITLAMTALATVALELSLADPERSPARCGLAALGLLVTPTFVAAWYFGRLGPRAHDPKRRGQTPLGVAMVLALFVAPFALEAGRLLLFGRIAMLEVVVLSAVRNLGLGLATVSHRTSRARLAAVVSLFLILVAASLSEGWLIAGLLGLYAVAGTSWLMIAYWSRAVGWSAGGGQRLPTTALAGVAGVAGVVVALAALLTVGPAEAVLALAGMMPTSGGTLWNDPDARGGVNDGDNEVAASERPESVGFTQSWAEVILPGGVAIAIEPTPGYRLMEPLLPWSERIAATLGLVLAWACDHAGALGLALLGLTAAFRYRREALDALATTAWAIRSRRDGRGCVLATLRLLERRSRWVGHTRPPGQTLARWGASITAADDEQAPGGLGGLIRLADWVLYAPGGEAQLPPWDEGEVRSTCQGVVRAWTLGRLRAAARTGSKEAATW